MDGYEINVETLLIVPFGRGKSKVYEFDREYIVDMLPLDIIKNSCFFFGCSYEGRKEAIKNILGIEMKVPILVEETKNIIFFPVSNCINKNSIWVSFQNLLKYSKLDEFSTVLYFRNNKSIVIDARYNLIDNQVIRCVKLDSLVVKRRDFLKNECLIIDDKSL